MLAALHLHTTWSDGELTIPQLRDRLRGLGCRWGLLADHASAFDAERAESYAAECAAHSDADFGFVAGLEFDGPDRMHIVGFGVTSLFDEADADGIIAHIGRSGGVSMIAHPPDRHFARIRSLATPPHGLEVWNTKYDGRYAPRPQTFDLLRDVRAAWPEVHAFYGLDFHWRRQFMGLLTELPDRPSDAAAVLDALRAGRFAARYRDLVLPPDGEIATPVRRDFARRQRWSAAMRGLVRGANRGLRRVGGTVPAPLKAGIRRWF